ncbi:MAG: manganese efflux pump [Burkholderiales bacterium]|nr:manganese efflux pump [Burkholderiales bacterium]
MSLGAIFFLALGLAMDAAAVSAARGIAVQRIRAGHAARVALYFGGFQALMPLLGWQIGTGIGSIVASVDHWIAFALLAAIGAKMLWESGDEHGEAAHAHGRNLFGTRVMLVLALATSLDALAAGITLPMLDAPLLASIATIGVTTACLSVAALYAGRRFGALLGRRLEALGGMMLIAIGGKILIEHLGAG